jgi:putative transposase
MICTYFDRTRQGYLQRLKETPKRLEFEAAVLWKVIEIRRDQPKAGVRKLRKHLWDDYQLKIGRDHLFELLRERNMLVRNVRRYKVCTNYKHGYMIYPNLLSQILVNRINQVLVSDITYLKTLTGTVYLYLVTDYFSRKILGYYVSDNLKAASAVTALHYAINRIPSTKGMIHHSDHGIQYCSDEYQKLLQKKGMIPSMTGKHRCYDNAVAERVNGILKNELNMNKTFVSLGVARQAVRDAVRIYNQQRLHLSLNYRTPGNVYDSFHPEATMQQTDLLVGA